ncbi:MAG: hypothetical protein RL632_251 [Bacteroidota bacterium]|jgi:hypothetical protein
MEAKLKSVKKIKFTKTVKMVSPPPGVRCKRPGNPSCAHPTTCAKLARCYYDK